MSDKQLVSKMVYNIAAKFTFFLLLVLLSRGSITAAESRTTNLGVIMDEDSRAGKEEKTAISIAVQKFNTGSENHKLAVHFKNSAANPLQAASSAEELIKEKNVHVITGMDTWEEAALVANIGEKAKVPVISFSAAAISPSLSHLRWPFLVQMTNVKISEETNCIASMVQSYNWKRVIVVYEDNAYGGEYKGLSLLSEALQKVGSEIEHSVSLPHVSSTLDLKESTIREEMAEVLRKQSRVFIVLKSSVQTTTCLFKEAYQLGLTGKDSVWILGDSFTSLLDSIDSSSFSFMQGALGIKIYYSDKTAPFSEFESSFRKSFRANYPEEDKSQPGIHAIRAYDSIDSVSKAIESLGDFNGTNSNFSKELLDTILSSKFSGLTGQIHFDNGKLSESPVYRIINIIGKSYKELGFWSAKLGFSNNLGEGNLGGDHSMKNLISSVNWPGDLQFRYPKGWSMPTDAKKLKIGVPTSTSFERFVKVQWEESSKETKYTGFCIEVFQEAVKAMEAKMGYSLLYEFVNHTGNSYEEMVDQVYKKNYDAVVGDFTILANRSSHVDFTQPYTESGLSMLVPVKEERHEAWKFLKPFTFEMWVATLSILFYTMFVVWFMEHQDNEEFRGPWKDQLGTALWFTFSSLFFAHREKIQSNYSKVVVMMWLFVVFILTAGYTASLTSMLTVRKLEPTVTDIEWLRKTNAPVGCDPDSFIGKYLKDVLELTNIKSIQKQEDYPGNFTNGNIDAAFLELPYQKVFLKEYCNRYTATGPAYRFGGLGFVFQKGSPITDDVSEAILYLSEEGVIRELEQKWLNTSQSCSETNLPLDSESLRLDSFWGIFLLSGLTSTTSFILFLYRLLRKHVQQVEQRIGSSNGSRWSRAVRLVLMVLRLNDNRVRPRETTPRAREERNPPLWELVSPSEIPAHLEAGRPTQLEIPMRKLDHIGESFP